MRLEQLLYLDDVKKTGSFTKTAQNFFHSQQGISDALRKLEDEWGLTLFNRSKSGITFTVAGEQILPYVEMLLNDFQLLEQQIQSLHQNTLKGNLKMSVHPRFYQYVFHEAVLVFMKAHPNVKVNILECVTNTTISSVLDGSCELGLVVLPSRFESIHDADLQKFQESIAVERLFSDTLMICAHKYSPWSKYTLIKRDILNKLPLIAFEQMFDWQKFSHTVDFTDANSTSTNLDVHRDLLTNGLAVTYLTPFEFSLHYQNNKAFKLIPLENPSKIELSLIYLRDHTLSLEAQYFIETLKTVKFPFN